MKNIIFYSISLSLIGLMWCHDEANVKLISLNILAPDEIENMLNTTFDDYFGSDDISPLSNYFKTIYCGSWNKLIDIFNKIFDNFLVDNSINETVINTAKRSIRNTNNITNGSLAQYIITKVQQNLSTSTESILLNKVAENQTQPQINYSLVTNSTPSADFLSATFINTRPLINNDAKQNNNARVNNISNVLYSLSTWSGFLTIKQHMNLVSIIVSSALLLLFLGIMQFVAYRAHRFRNFRREIRQEQEILL